MNIKVYDGDQCITATTGKEAKQILAGIVDRNVQARKEELERQKKETDNAEICD